MLRIIESTFDVRMRDSCTRRTPAAVGRVVLSLLTSMTQQFSRA
jgi:hypothetical protein